MLIASYPNQFFLTVVCSLGILGPGQLFADENRPSAPRLLPEATLAYIRLADTPELVEKFQQTGLGRIFQDERIRPLVSDLYASAVDAFTQIEGRVGAPLGEVLSIFQGELSVALVAPEQGEVALVVLAEVRDQLPNAEKVVERLGEYLTEQGATASQERCHGTTLQLYQLAGEQERQVVHFQRDGVIAVATNLEIARGLLQAWQGEATPTLSDNPRFAAIANRCGGGQTESPNITFFLDPIALTKKIGRGNLAVTAVLGLLPALGLDGLQGFGGSIALATDEFDSLTHLHLLLAPSRSGVLQMLALQSGDTTPEPWVPADVANYVTLHWDFDQSYSALETVYDSIRGENKLAEDVRERIAEPWGVDFREEIIDQLEGRITYITWMVKPARLNSRSSLIGLKLKDVKRSRKTLERVAENLETRLGQETFAGVTYYRIAANTNRTQDQNGRSLMRAPERCVAILGDYLLLTDSIELLKHVIVTKGDPSQSLGRELEFRLIASKVRRQTSGNQAGMLAFSRPEESLRLWYELANSDDARQRLSTAAENNATLRALHEALINNPLPPFAVISRYLAPGGSLLTNEETGFHYTTFTLKRK